MQFDKYTTLQSVHITILLPPIKYQLMWLTYQTGLHKILMLILVLGGWRINKTPSGFWTIVFIFIVISITFQSICPPAFFRCLSNSRTYTELRTMSFIESMGVACSDPICHNRVQVLSIPVLLLTCSNNTGILNTCTWLWLTESEQVTPMDSIKDIVWSSM